MQFDVRQLAQQWILEQAQDPETRSDDPSVETATDIVLHLPYESTSAAWAFVEQVLRLTASEKILGILAAGSLESLIAHDHANAVSKLKLLVERYPILRKMLQGVWQSDIPDAVWREIVMLRADNEKGPVG
jgi:hypothetical protein